VLATYRTAITLDPTFAAAHAGYALVAVALWESSLDTLSPSLAARTQAYASAGQALQIDPDNARALIVLSRIQAQDGASQLALSTARQATKAQPASAEARANLALVLSFGGRTSEARSELAQLRRLDPAPRPQWMLVYGQAAFADDRYDAAIADFVSVWPDFPRSTLLLAHLAASLALQGRFIQASEMTDRLLTVMPRANLHLIAQRFATLRDPRQNGHLLEGLRRSGLPEWPYGFHGSEDQRLAGSDLASIAMGVKWSGHLGDGSTFAMHVDAEGVFTFRSDSGEMTGQQSLRDGLLCQVTSVQPAKEDCGPLYHNADDPTGESPFVFVSAEEVRYFSVAD
jgi:adenylate cyclase